MSNYFASKYFLLFFMDSDSTTITTAYDHLYVLIMKSNYMNIIQFILSILLKLNHHMKIKLHLCDTTRWT